MSDTAGAGASAPDPGVTAGQADAEALAEAIAAVTGIPRDQLPSAADLAGAVQAFTGPPPPLAQDQVNAAAQVMADQALEHYERSMAAAMHTRDHAQSLLESATAMEAKAAADRDRTLANADRLRTGDPLEPPPPPTPDPDGAPGGPTSFGELTAEGGA